MGNPGAWAGTIVACVSDIKTGDLATWFGAIVALLAAWFTYRQLRSSISAGAADDERSKKRTAIELAQEWCRTEAPSPISIMRECFANMKPCVVKHLLDGESVTLDERFLGEIEAFFSETLRGHGSTEFKPNGSVVKIEKNESELLRNYFARRLNFLEVVAAACNSKVGDERLIKQFFGEIIKANPSYREAVKLHPDVWPELTEFYGLTLTKRDHRQPLVVAKQAR